MRKKLIILTCCLLITISGCGNTAESNDSVKKNETINLVVEAPEESGLESDDISEIPDLNGFNEVLQKIASNIDAGTVTTLTYLSCDSLDDVVKCNFTFKYKDREAFAYFGYDNETWIPIWVIDAKTSEVYWVGDGMEEYLPPFSKKKDSETTKENTSEQSAERDDHTYLSEKMALPSYETVTGEALADIGFTQITDMKLEEVEVSDDGDIHLSWIVADYDGKKVILKCMYMNVVDIWSSISIEDYETNCLYWVCEGSEKYYDIYDYKTGDIISKQSETFDLEKLQDEYEKENAEISAQFEKDLEELAEKYGTGN